MNISNKDNLKIAVVYLGRKGGGAAYAFEMAKGLVENDCQVYLFVSKYAENLSSWLSLKTAHTEIIKTYRGKFSFVLNSFLFRFFVSKKIFKKYRNTFVDACYIPMMHSWDCYIVNALHNPMKIVTIHDPINHSSNNSSRGLYEKVSAFINRGVHDKKPDEIIILSSCFLDTVADNNHIDKSHIHVVPHCIFDNYESARAIDYYEFDTSKVNFLFFGRIDKYKGIEILGEAFEKFYRWNRDSTLTIVGSGDFKPYEKKFQTMASFSLINRWIKDEEVASFFVPNKNVILVLPYLDATQSGVIPIAMLAGIPIIASNAGGLSEQIQNQETGFLFETGDVQSLFEKMKFVSSRNNGDVIANAKHYISKLTGKDLSRRIIQIVDKQKND